MNDKFKRIEVGMDSFKKLGINRLTGEACALSMRGLCELTREAMELLLEYLGLRVDLDLVPRSNWNDSKRFAVFLTWEAMRDLLIMNCAKEYTFVQSVKEHESGREWLYCGERDTIFEHMKSHKSIYGYYDNETMVYVEGACYEVGRTYGFYDSPRRGFSNIHAFSGTSQ